jgi:hypothetical protein
MVRYWVHLVDIAEKIRELTHEVGALKVAEAVRGGESTEHVGGEGLDVLGEAEQVALADADRADLAGPGEEALKMRRWKACRWARS